MKATRGTSKKEGEIQLQITLIAPPAGVAFGVQEGKGNDYTTIQRTTSNGGDVSFRVAVQVKNNREDGLPNFLEPFTHGPPTGRFIYLGVGKLAGQIDSCWERRVKIPLSGIDWKLVEQALAGALLEASFPGTDKRGGPICASVKPISGWKATKGKT